MKTIYKYPIKITDQQTLTLPVGHKVVLVGLDPSGVPCLWALVDPERTVLPVRLFVVGTGRPLPEDAQHVGSFIEGVFVWHLFLRD